MCVCAAVQGVLCYGPPGTGKTLIARAIAAQTNATFLKLAGPQLVQVRMFTQRDSKMKRAAVQYKRDTTQRQIYVSP